MAFLGVPGKAQPGAFEPGQVSAGTPPTSASAIGRTICQGFAVAALVVSAVGSVVTSGTAPLRASAVGIATAGGSATGTIGTAKIRVTQECAEVVYEQTTDAKIRVTQVCAGVVYEQTTNARLRITQLVAEVVIEESPYVTGVTRCSGSALVTGDLVAIATGRVSGSGNITSALSIPVKARGRTGPSGRALLTILRIAAIGQASAAGGIQPAIGVVAEGKAAAGGSILATLDIYAVATGVVQASGDMPKGYISTVARGQVGAHGYAVIGINGSGPECLTAKDSTGAVIPNFVY